MATSSAPPGAIGPGSHRTGIALFFVGLLGFGFFDAASKQLLLTYPAPFLNVIRYATVCLVAIGLWLKNGRHFPVPARFRGLLLARGVALGTVGTCFMTALIWMPLAEATAIYFTSPLLVVALSPWFLQERVSPAKWLAVSAGFVGMLFIVRPGNELPWLGTVLMVVSAISFALFQLLTRKLAAHVPNHVQYGTTAILCLVITAVPAPFFLPQPWPDALTLLMIVAISSTNALAQVLLLAAFQRIAASTLAPFNYFQLLIAVVISATWFKQAPDNLALLGIGLIAAGGLYLARPERQKLT